METKREAKVAASRVLGRASRRPCGFAPTSIAENPATASSLTIATSEEDPTAMVPGKMAMASMATTDARSTPETKTFFCRETGTQAAFCRNLKEPTKSILKEHLKPDKMTKN